MKSILTKMQKDVAIILSAFCILILLFGSIGYASLVREITELKATNKRQDRELDDHDTEIFSLSSVQDDISELYLRKPLQDHSNYHLLNEVAAENQKLTKLKNEHDVMYTWDEFINEEYNKAREDEYLSAFKAAISTDENLRKSVLCYLHDLCGYEVDMPYTLTDLDEADEASKASAIEHFVNRLRLATDGNVLYYPFDGDIRPYHTFFTLRYISSSDLDYFDENSGYGPVFKTAENYEPEYDENDIHIWYEYKTAGLCCIYFY